MTVGGVNPTLHSLGLILGLANLGSAAGTFIDTGVEDCARPWKCDTRNVDIRYVVHGSDQQRHLQYQYS